MLKEAALLPRNFGHLIFCDSILLRFRFRIRNRNRNLLQFRFQHGKKLRFLRFRFRNTASNVGDLVYV